MPTVRIPTPLRPLTQNQVEVPAQGATVAAVLADLTQTFPGLKERLLDGDGKVHRYINLFVGDEDIRFLQDLATPVGPSDKLSIVPAIAGGC
jgi:molybdopterin synthase sulfur carrier subunit